MSADGAPDEPELIIERDGAVCHLVLNRPDKLNALNLMQHDRIITAVEQADADPDLRAIVFSGQGRAFCAGDDLIGARAMPDRWAARAVKLDIGMGPTALLEVCAVIRHTSTPTVALLHGHALGSGYDYSLSCDFRVATEDVNYGDPRMHRAMWAAEGWSYKLVRQLNQSQTTPIAYLGQTMSGREAYDRGLLHRVYPAGENLRQVAAPFLEQVAALDASAFAASKRRLLRALDQDFETALTNT